MYWCTDCNVPLLSQTCGICGNSGRIIRLSEPGDVRFCSAYENEIIDRLINREFGCNPVKGKTVLLNKIPGDDKTCEILADGLLFGILRYDLADLEWKFDLRIGGAKILLDATSGNRKTVTVRKKGTHLSGKTVTGYDVLHFTDDIRAGDTILVKAGNLSGYGTAYTDSQHMPGSDPAIRIRKIDSSDVKLLSASPSIEKILSANAAHMKHLVRDALNTIRGIANQKEFSEAPVYVSFSGGKDSLTALDLTRTALKGRKIKVFFANTGIEFPETVNFLRDYCMENNIDLTEVDAGDAFWKNLPVFGPPSKDYRWCCKICKLAPINSVFEGIKGRCLTIDGKRKFESFTRSTIAPTEENPFIPHQVNVFPTRNWRAIEVWMYIYYKKMKYNPLYDTGFERVGCWLCPAELAAEYSRFSEIHPELFKKWNDSLIKWADENGLEAGYIRHGFWRWKQLPPKMLRLADTLGINTRITGKADEVFSVKVTSGISPCKAGGYTIEGVVKGIRVQDASGALKVMGMTIYSEDLGLLFIRSNTGTVKLFASGHISVTCPDEKKAKELFAITSKQLTRVARCSGCGVCMKVCPAGAITVNPLMINDRCNRCGKCVEVCVAARYFRESEGFYPQN